MTPKEKAIELFDKFSLNYYHAPNAKQCAIIAVDELIKYLPVSSRILTDFTELDKQYWKEVKTEIELL